MARKLSLAFGIALGVTSLVGISAIAQQTTDHLDVSADFIASGYMGDPSLLDQSWTDNPHSGPESIRVEYTPGSKGFSGMYWQNRPDNWCLKPGEDFSSRKYSRITFWARGETGSERIEFKAGGILRCAAGGDYEDSFEVKLGLTRLSKKWRQYSMPIDRVDLSSVIGGFAWIAARDRNPKGAVFYLDDIRYE